MRLRTLDGRWIWFKNSFCHSGTRWHAMLRDLSEAKRVEARAALSVGHICGRCRLTDLSCVQTSLRDFLATTSHDARTPLSSIQVCARLCVLRALGMLLTVDHAAASHRLLRSCWRSGTCRRRRATC
jgi:hypothetical protein